MTDAPTWLTEEQLAEVESSLEKEFIVATVQEMRALLAMARHALAWTPDKVGRMFATLRWIAAHPNEEGATHGLYAMRYAARDVLDDQVMSQAVGAYLDQSAEIERLRAVQLIDQTTLGAFTSSLSEMLGNARAEGAADMREKAAQAVMEAAWRHDGVDAYSRGLDRGALTQLQRCFDAIRDLPLPTNHSPDQGDDDGV